MATYSGDTLSALNEQKNLALKGSIPAKTNLNKKIDFRGPVLSSLKRQKDEIIADISEGNVGPQTVLAETPVSRTESERLLAMTQQNIPEEKREEYAFQAALQAKYEDDEKAAKDLVQAAYQTEDAGFLPYERNAAQIEAYARRKSALQKAARDYNAALPLGAPLSRYKDEQGWDL